MELIRKETCLEYFTRRLSEGWKCINFKFPHAVLLSPTGFRREIDLRNDVETLRPSGDGDEINLSIAGSSPAATNWESVDEVIADDSVTLVREVTTTYNRDLYEIPASSGNGTINKITVFIRVRIESGQ